MSHQRRDDQYLGDLLEAIRRISVYIAGLSLKQFLEDTKTQDAVLRNLQVIGEGVKKLSPALRKAHPHLPWKEMAGMRDRIIHDYFGVNYDIVWTVVHDELPMLLLQIEAIQSERGVEGLLSR